jgi:hypothetical protein
MTHTHTGFTRYVGHVHTGRSYGHGDYRGRRHALKGTAQHPYHGARYTALCGEVVVSTDDVDERPNVVPVGQCDRVTCKRCLRLIARRED